MQAFEYKVVPAPEKGKSSKGIKGGAARFAHALETLMNTLAQEGWQYVRADTLPSQERVGLTGKTTVYQNMLVFRRSLETAAPVSRNMGMADISASNAPSILDHTAVPAPLRTEPVRNEPMRNEPVHPTRPVMAATSPAHVRGSIEPLPAVTTDPQGTNTPAPQTPPTDV
ncbi:MAG: hypothetical protein ACJA1E_001508 [Paracoccaceae bacterium]|jgi:hypothetical protein